MLTTETKNNKVVLQFDPHCPSAPTHAYKYDATNTNNKSSLVETFYINILNALLNDESIAQISIPHKRFNVISLSYKYSSNINTT